MLRSTLRLLALIACSQLALAAADDNKETRTAQQDRSCAGVSNEFTKMRELRRELGAYLGQTIPEELQSKVRRHVELVAKLKAECEQLREQAALGK
ncbi:MAG: hypothetical protein JWQ76_864 [Ramlibacter sp.]|nr:hypothetical protein [Ramlibacter sp.]